METKKYKLLIYSIKICFVVVEYVVSVSFCGEMTMASSYKEKNRTDIRVSIAQKDLEALGAKDVPQEKVLQWIKIGRERSAIANEMNSIRSEIRSLRELLETIQDEQRRHISLSANLANMSVILSSVDHFRVKLVRKKVSEKMNLNDEDLGINKLIEIKSKNFRKYMSNLFPSLKSSSFLTTTVSDSDKED